MNIGICVEQLMQPPFKHSSAIMCYKALVPITHLLGCPEKVMSGKNGDAKLPDHVVILVHVYKLQWSRPPLTM